MTNHQHGADILPFSRNLDPDQLQRIYGDIGPVDLYESLRANAVPAPRLAVLRDRSLRLRASRAIAFAIMLVCTLYAISLWVLP